MEKTYKGFLKIFESTRKEEIKKIFSPYINFDLISDAKDMALEYLDEGYIFCLLITYNDDVIYQTEYSHHERSFTTWDPLNIIDRGIKYGPISILNIENNKMEYMLCIVSPENENSLRRVNDSYTEEIVSRLKEAYPNEKISGI